MSIIIITLIVLALVVTIVMLSRYDFTWNYFKVGNQVRTYTATGNSDAPFKECMRFAIRERVFDIIHFNYVSGSGGSIPIGSMLEYYDKVEIYDENENLIYTFNKK